MEQCEEQNNSLLWQPVSPSEAQLSVFAHLWSPLTSLKCNGSHASLSPFTFECLLLGYIFSEPGHPTFEKPKLSHGETRCSCFNGTTPAEPSASSRHQLPATRVSLMVDQPLQVSGWPQPYPTSDHNYRRNLWWKLSNAQPTQKPMRDNDCVLKHSDLTGLLHSNRHLEKHKMEQTRKS